jgi:hypothetical protein
MERTYDLRNRWSATITAFCQYTNAELERFRFTADVLTSFVNFVKANDFVFTDEELRLWCADHDYNCAPLIRQWMRRVPEFRVVTPNVIA